MYLQRTKIKLLSRLVIAGIMIAADGRSAMAQSTVNLGTVQAGATGGSTSVSAVQQPAPYQAPTQGSLTATQPQSIISQQYIENNTSPTSTYADIVKISPSVWSVDPNGPGLMETQELEMRGFQDGQFNVTFDGIPWGDSNDFTHHTTSYFLSQDMGRIVADRGPGTASTIGPATFGGTIANYSKDPKEAASITPTLSFGSFNTKVQGIEFDTGTLAKYGDARAFFDYNQIQSDGYLTNEKQRRKNAFFKLIKPVGDNTLLTFVAMHETLHQNVGLGATAQQIATFGPNWGLSSDPNSQDYFGYNYDKINTDFEYFGIKSLLGSLQVNNKIYTYGYNHQGFNGLDPNGETANGTSISPTDVPGQRMIMVYRSIGDLLRLTQFTTKGKINFGIWVDHQANTRGQWEIDENTNGFNTANGNPVDRNQQDTLVNMQPYAEFVWNVTNKLTVTPGLKEAYFSRNLNAVVNQGTGLPLQYSRSWNKLLPSIDAHYKLSSNWSAYVQYAQGFIAPNLNTLYVTNPSLSSFDPESTKNYQAGTTWSSPRLTLSADVYDILFSNKIGSKTIAGNTIFLNLGGATYKGFESEATYYVGMGLSAYGNFSLNSAKDKTTGQWMANAPKDTAATGLIYNKGPVYLSAITKFVGSRYGDNGESQHLGGYATTDMAFNYTLKNADGYLKNAKIGLRLNNLFDRKNIFALAGYTGGANTPLYWTVPGRSFEVTVSTSM